MFLSTYSVEFSIAFHPVRLTRNDIFKLGIYYLKTCLYTIGKYYTYTSGNFSQTWKFVSLILLKEILSYFRVIKISLFVRKKGRQN